MEEHRLKTERKKIYSPITRDYVLSFMRYNPDTGIFSIREDFDHKKFGVKKVRIWPGKIIGSRNPYGYLYTGINNKSYALHRLAFLIMEGALPGKKYQVDHLNGNPSDNRWANLRLCSPSENSSNQKMRPNKSGLKGVSFDNRKGKFRARITKNNKEKWLGYFNTASEAHQCYLENAKKIHGVFFSDGVRD